MSYKAAQKEFLAKNNIIIGSKVKVFQKAHHEQNDWPMYWTSEQDKCVGKKFKVHEIYDNGILLDCKGEFWLFPYFVLSK